MKQWNNYKGEDFTFVVCAYKECPYLEESVKSLLNQSVKANVLISTSTPNKYIRDIAGKYNIKVRVNPNGGQIKDYNFAMKQAKTKLIMLAHQDEILRPDFVKETLFALNHTRKPIIAFTDYIEMHNDVVDKKQSSLIKIKKIMLLPAKWKWLTGTTLGKWLILCLGDPITHPSVVCVAKEMPRAPFREAYKATMDWDLWQRLSKRKGSFVYVDKILLQHRMNDDNQSSVLLKTTNARYEEEYRIFCRFWPRPIARLIMKVYSKAYNYY